MATVQDDRYIYTCMRRPLVPLPLLHSINGMMALERGSVRDGGQSSEARVLRTANGIYLLVWLWRSLNALKYQQCQ